MPILSWWGTQGWKDHSATLKALPASSWGMSRSAEATGVGGRFRFCCLVRLEGGKGNTPLFAGGHGPVSWMQKALVINYCLLYRAHYVVLLHIGGFFGIKLFTSSVHRITYEKTKLMFHCKAAKQHKNMHIINFYFLY